MKKALMYGAGNIGRGFIGQLFSESGYEVAYIDVNMEVINRLNADGGYPVYIAKGTEYEEHWTKNVSGVDGRDNKAIAEAMASADIMATAVGVKILKFIAAPFAEGVKLRMARNIEAPLNVIICENMIDADKYFIGLVKENLNEEEQAYFDGHIALIEPSIGRTVTAAPADIAAKHPLAVCAEPYCELPVDKAAFKGEIPEIKNLVPFTPFEFYIRRKLFMHNMSHATTSYFGFLKGYTYVWEAAKDPEIQLIALRALTESSKALSAEYGVKLEDLLAFSEDLLFRYQNVLLGDTIERVGKDTQRKLSENDRLVGTAKLCLAHGIMPKNICAAIAAALFFAPESDPQALEVSAYAKENGVKAALVKYSAIDEASPIVPVAEAVYAKLAAGEKLGDIICYLQNL